MPRIGLTASRDLRITTVHSCCAWVQLGSPLLANVSTSGVKLGRPCTWCWRTHPCSLRIFQIFCVLFTSCAKLSSQSFVALKENHTQTEMSLPMLTE